MSKYGECDNCKTTLEPVKFVEKEYDVYNIPTGRVRLAVSYLVCPECGEIFTVDSSFDGPWVDKRFLT